MFVAIAMLLCGLSALLHAQSAVDQLASQSEIASADYLGFHVEDEKGLLGAESKAALTAQLRIVESVEVPGPVLSFFKSVHIIIDPSQWKQPGEFAYRHGHWAIFIQDKPLVSDRPIVLHELLHAYHLAISRTDGQQIMAAYNRGVLKGVYPDAYKKAHFLENEKEYFAVIGSIYLFGPIQQPPFNCAIVQERSPEFLELLARQFGSHSCR